MTKQDAPVNHDAGKITVTRDMIETTAVFEDRPVRIPRIIVQGNEPGPTFTITAGQHGRELNGIEACRRLIELLPTLPLRGRVVLFPVVNPPAVAHVRQVVPGETQNINRIWPGDAKGTQTERITAALAPLIAQSDWLIDLHGWSDWTVDVVLTGSGEDSAILDLARACGLGYVYCNLKGFQPGNLKTFAKSHGVVAVGFELTPQWRLREEAVALGVRGLLNGLKHAGMIPGEPELPPKQWRYQTDTPHHDLMAESHGLFIQLARVGSSVKKGQTLGELYSYETLQNIQTITSPIDGVLINLGPTREGVETNTVNQGDMLAQVWQATTL